MFTGGSAYPAVSIVSGIVKASSFKLAILVDYYIGICDFKAFGIAHTVFQRQRARAI
jgi:hypothetical protein